MSIPETHLKLKKQKLIELVLCKANTNGLKGWGGRWSKRMDGAGNSSLLCPGELKDRVGAGPVLQSLAFFKKSQKFGFLCEICLKTMVQVRKIISDIIIISSQYMCASGTAPVSSDFYQHCCLPFSPFFLFWLVFFPLLPLNFMILSVYMSLVNTRTLFFQAMNQLNPTAHLIFVCVCVIIASSCGNHIIALILYPSCIHILCHVTLGFFH